MISTDLVAYAIEHNDADDSDVLNRYWSISPVHSLPDLDSAIIDYVNSYHADPGVLNEISQAEHLHPTAVRPKDDELDLNEKSGTVDADETGTRV